MSAPHQQSLEAAPADEAVIDDAVVDDAVLDETGFHQPGLEHAADDDAGPEARATGEPAPDGGGSGPRTAAAGEELLVREGDVAGDYLERLLDILDVDGDIDLDVEGDRASVAIVGGRLDDLVGQDGATLEALQELTRLAVAQATGVRSRLMLDVGGFRARRRADLTALAGAAAERVARSGQRERLEPMNPFERKVVHDVISGVPGVHSESEGEEPQRRVVVLPDR